MDDNIVELEEEIALLKKRISILEGKENRRKAYGYLKTIFKIVAIMMIIFAIWKGYDYVVNEVPKIIENKISSLNPLNKK